MNSSYDPSFLAACERAGISKIDVDEQLHRLRCPKPSVKVERPCTVSDGIVQLDQNERDHYYQEGKKRLEAKQVSKFVPASGAATRMFKDLLEATNETDELQTSQVVARFVEALSKFPFYHALKTRCDRENISLVPPISQNLLPRLLELTMHSPGLGLSGQPKALIPFHTYGNEARNALEEHLQEAIEMNVSHPLPVHATANESHVDSMNKCVANFVIPNGVAVKVNFSTQSSATDTLALYENGDVVFDSSGNPLLRPGGHGSLIGNLDHVATRFAFVQNIDNIAHGWARSEINQQRIPMLGLAAALTSSQDSLIDWLENPGKPADEVKDAYSLLKKYLGTSCTVPFQQLTSSRELAIRQLNRPIRVCSMVKNQGEPGGGPFWVEGPFGLRPEIVESAEMDLTSEQQAVLVEQSTHFNPVDMVLVLHDRNKKRYELANFVDQDRYFIATKSFEGKPITVLEHPGLWNGAMSGWLTVFVECPIETFNPVKTVFDFLRPQHQPKPLI